VVEEEPQVSEEVAEEEEPEAVTLEETEN